MIIPGLPGKVLDFQGRSLPYFYHRYNMTWASERCIEIPIAKTYLDQTAPEHCLEIGNVMSHYFPVQHRILDKFEKGPNIINQDIVGFTSEHKFALVLSISTFEHIGFDDEAQGSSADKIKEAIGSTQKLLSETGKLVITAPIGYNPELDNLIRQKSLATTREFFFKRTQSLTWEACHHEAALACHYKHPFPYANALWVAEFEKNERQA